MLKVNHHRIPEWFKGCKCSECGKGPNNVRWWERGKFKGAKVEADEQGQGVEPEKKVICFLCQKAKASSLTAAKAKEENDRLAHINSVTENRDIKKSSRALQLSNPGTPTPVFHGQRRSRRLSNPIAHRCKIEEILSYLELSKVNASTSFKKQNAEIG